MAEYIDREAVRDALYDADAITMRGVEILNQYPAADVVEIPKEIAKERLAEILQAEIEGRLKMSKPPLMETCGSCKHFHPYPGMATGPCDCRVKLDRQKQPTSQVLYVSQSRVRCRDDYEPREGAT